MKKILPLVLCAVISAGTLCACGNDEVKTEDLPYGTTLRQLNDTQIEICFDNRFFTDDEMRAVNDYYYSVQTQDKDLFMSTQSKEYVEYIEENSGMGVESFIEAIYDEAAASLGEGFEYIYIEAVSYGDRTDDLEIDEITTIMNGIYEEAGKDKTFEETVTSAKYAVLDFMAESNGSSYTFKGQTVYIFTCTDGVYLFT